MAMHRVLFVCRKGANVSMVVAKSGIALGGVDGSVGRSEGPRPWTPGFGEHCLFLLGFSCSPRVLLFFLGL
jgi:hypothetical protein